jgi:sugar phosphate isomerase/epimerase
MSSLPGMKFAICNEIFRGWNIQDILSWTAKAGYHAVEIAPFTLADSVTDIPALARKEILEGAQQNGIEIAGIHWVLVKPEGLYMNHPDPEIRKRTSRSWRA